MDVFAASYDACGFSLVWPSCCFPLLQSSFDSLRRSRRRKHGLGVTVSRKIDLVCCTCQPDGDVPDRACVRAPHSGQRAARPGVRKKDVKMHHPVSARCTSTCKVCKTRASFPCNLRLLARSSSMTVQNLGCRCTPVDAPPNGLRASCRCPAAITHVDQTAGLMKLINKSDFEAKRILLHVQGFACSAERLCNLPRTVAALATHFI